MTYFDLKSTCNDMTAAAILEDEFASQINAFVIDNHHGMRCMNTVLPPDNGGLMETFSNGIHRWQDGRCLKGS